MIALAGIPALRRDRAPVAAGVLSRNGAHRHDQHTQSTCDQQKTAFSDYCDKQVKTESRKREEAERKQSELLAHGNELLARGEFFGVCTFVHT